MIQRFVFLVVVFTLSSFSSFAQKKNQDVYKDWRKETTSDFTFYIPRNLREANSIYEPRKSFIRLYATAGESSLFAVSLYTELRAETKKSLSIVEVEVPDTVIETRSVRLKGAIKAVRTLKESKLKSGERIYKYELEILKNGNDEKIFLSVVFDEPEMKETAEQILGSLMIKQN